MVKRIVWDTMEVEVKFALLAEAVLNEGNEKCRVQGIARERTKQAGSATKRASIVESTDHLITQDWLIWSQTSRCTLSGAVNRRA